MDTKIQKLLKKLISEEWLAGQMYKLFIISVKDCMYDDVLETFNITAEDELNDHMLHLVTFAKTYDFKVPSTYKEFIKFANPDDVKQFESFKSEKNLEYYLDESIKSEQNAVNSYNEAIAEVQKYDSDASYEFSLLLNQILFDEIEHLETFNFIKTQIEAFKKYENF